MRYVFISRMTRIRFKNRYIAGILLFTNRIHCQYARFATQGYFAHFGRIVYVLVEILWINLYFESLMIPSAVIGSLAHIPGSLSRFKYLPMLSPVVREASVVAPTVSNVNSMPSLRNFCDPSSFVFHCFSDCKFIAVE